MDTTGIRTWTRRSAVATMVAVGVVGLEARPASPAPPALTLHGADAAQARTVAWATERFRTAGLESLPPLHVVLHATRTPCDGYLGLFSSGRIDLCTEGLLEPSARKFALHEMAHAWIEANVSAEVLDRFLRARCIATWNDRQRPWSERGAEQAAEIVAWGLGEGKVAPRLPEAVDPATLADLFELLTGRPPITPAA